MLLVRTMSRFFPSGAQCLKEVMFYTAEQKRDYFLLLVCKLSGVLFCTLFGVCSDGIVLAKPALLRQENWSRPGLGLDSDFFELRGRIPFFHLRGRLSRKRASWQRDVRWWDDDHGRHRRSLP